MSIELKQAAEQALKELGEARKIVRASSSRQLAKDWDRRATDALANLRTAIQQGQQPVTGEPERCKSCDNTGHVVDQIGEWRGICNCPEGDAIREKKTATPEPVMDVRCEGCGYMTHHREHMGCVRAAKQHTHQAPSVPDDVVRDAKRYEWLRQHQLLAKINYMPTPSGEDLDAAIDAAMLAAKKETP